MKPIKLIARDTGAGMLSYELMKEARKLKAALKRFTSSDSAYYAVLARFELGHFDQIATVSLEKGKDPASYAKEVMAALQMEINAAEWEAGESSVPAEPAKGPKKKSKLFLAFKSEAAFEEVREHLRILTGNDVFYNQTLLAYGYQSANEIPSHEAGIKPYKDLCIERNRIQLEKETLRAAGQIVGPERAKELIDTLHKAYQALGPGPFYAVLDKYGCPTIDYAVRSFELEKIMQELKECVDYRNKQ